MPIHSRTPDAQWKILARNDWGEILELLKKKTFQRKFKIVEAFVEEVAARGILKVSHSNLAKRCGVTRQLIDHHFPNRTDLMSLSYRYIYARFQKLAADATVARRGFLNQFDAYIRSCALWPAKYNSDTRFLLQFYALSPHDPELLELHKRNTAIGRDRLQTLFIRAREENQFHGISDATLADYASSVQHRIIGYLIIFSTLNADSKSFKVQEAELLRSCFGILNIQRPEIAY